MLGKRLKDLRGKRTQQDIADSLGVSRASYSHYENDHVQPDNETLTKLAALYKVSIDYLLGREPLIPKNIDEVDEMFVEEYLSYDEKKKEKLRKLMGIVREE